MLNNGQATQTSENKPRKPQNKVKRADIFRVATLERGPNQVTVENFVVEKRPNLDLLREIGQGGSIKCLTKGATNGSQEEPAV